MVRTSRSGLLRKVALAGLGVVFVALSCKGRDTTGPSAVESVSVTPSTATFVTVGLTQQLSATPRDAGGGALANEPISWTSSDTSIATVSASGLVTGIAPGTANLTATCLGRSGTATVIVQLPLAALTMSQSSATVASGAALNLTATPTDSVGDVVQGVAIKWTSSNASVATVAGGSGAGGLVVAVAPGTATISATSGSVVATATITVVGTNVGPVASIAIRPSTATFVEGPQGFGAPLQLTAVLADASGNALSGLPVVWSSSDTTAATVTQGGLLTPNPTVAAVSNVTITATGGGISATASILVSPQVISVSITPTNPTVALGQTTRLVATPMDASGHPMIGVPVGWTNFNANIVRLERMGDTVTVVPVVQGAATIVAGAGSSGASATVTVAVTAGSSLSVRPR